MLKKLNNLEIGILVSLWNNILEIFNCISEKLQSVQMYLIIAIS